MPIPELSLYEAAAVAGIASALVTISVPILQFWWKQWQKAADVGRHGRNVENTTNELHKAVDRGDQRAALVLLTQLRQAITRQLRYEMGTLSGTLHAGVVMMIFAGVFLLVAVGTDEPISAIEGWGATYALTLMVTATLWYALELHDTWRTQRAIARHTAYEKLPKGAAERLGLAAPPATPRISQEGTTLDEPLRGAVWPFRLTAWSARAMWWLATSRASGATAGARIFRGMVALMTVAMAPLLVIGFIVVLWRGRWYHARTLIPEPGRETTLDLHAVARYRPPRGLRRVGILDNLMTSHPAARRAASPLMGMLGQLTREVDADGITLRLTPATPDHARKYATILKRKGGRVTTTKRFGLPMRMERAPREPR